MAKSAVKVISQSEVAGMDATILKADDVAALEAWLIKNNYPFSPSLRAWSQRYVEKGWYLTAFKMSKNSKQESQELQSKLVELKFKTKRPFYPYREPKAADSGHPRSLKVFMISPQPPEPRIGTKIADGDTRVVHAEPGAYRALFAGTSLEKVIPPKAWLSEIEDHANPRPGDDEMWLPAAADPKIIKRGNVINDVPTEIPVPLDLLALVGWVVFTKRKKTQHPI